MLYRSRKMLSGLCDTGPATRTYSEMTGLILTPGRLCLTKLTFERLSKNFGNVIILT